MTDIASGTGPGGARTEAAAFVSVPVRARDEIGELAFYLEQVRRNLLEVNAHVTGSSETMPMVLHELKDIVQMTERATLRVLEETEALLEEGQAVLDLLDGARREAGDDAAGPVVTALRAVHDVVRKSNDRAMAIMSALEFQDLTSQKIQRAFEVLEEVSARLQRIHGLVMPAQQGQAAPAPQGPRLALPPEQAERKSGQDLADELLMQFRS